MLLARVVMGDVNWFISTIVMRKTKKNIGLLYRKKEELSTNDSKKAEMCNGFFCINLLKRSTLNCCVVQLTLVRKGKVKEQVGNPKSVRSFKIF